MASRIKANSGLSEAVSQRIKAMHPAISERIGDNDQNVRKAINTLLNADFEVIFLNFLALLPCLEKLGNDFLLFKRPIMLATEHTDAASILDTVVGNFRKDIGNLQRYLTPKLKLPQLDEYKRPRAEALAYAEHCNGFKSSPTSESVKEKIKERLELACQNPVPILPMPVSSLPDENKVGKSKAHARGASVPTSKLPAANPNKVRKNNSRASQACDTCKRRKNKCGKNPTCEIVLAAKKVHKKSASLPEAIMPRPYFDSLDGDSVVHTRNSSVAITPTDVDGFGDIGIAARDLNPGFGPFLGPETMTNTQFIGVGSFSGHIPCGGEAAFDWDDSWNKPIFTPGSAGMDVWYTTMYGRHRIFQWRLVLDQW